MKLKLFSFVASLFISISLFANAAHTASDAITGSLSGTVTDKADGKPISGATISIPDLRAGAVTDAAGKYIINHIPRGIYLVRLAI
jgi:iron complex outermembrane receptor protein